MKGRSIVDAVAVFTVLQVLMIIPAGVRDLTRWETRNLGGSYLSGLLMVTLAVMAVMMRGNEFRHMGLSIGRWRNSINIGFKGWLLFIIPQLALSFFGVWEIRMQDQLPVAVFMSVLVLGACIPLITGETGPASDRRIILIALALILPNALSFFIGTFTKRLLLEYIWNIAVGGFAEEFFYRGYIQSSINQEYGTEWKIGDTSFGPGLFITAALYGISRGIRTMNPLAGVYRFSWGWSIYTFTLGVFYGLIREKAGDMLASGTTNSMIDAIGRGLVRATW